MNWTKASWGAVGLLVFLGLGFSGCGPDRRASQNEAPDLQGGPLASPVNTPGKKKGASELWSANCAQCHNMRSPSSYSDDEWEVAANHMRIRAGLTANESRKITEFLKAGN